MSGATGGGGVGGAESGAMTGMGAGATIGTMVVPGIGTAIGAVVGAVVGGVAGYFMGGTPAPVYVTDLNIPTSQYGTGVAQVFGIARVSGNIIWTGTAQAHMEQIHSKK